MIRRRGFIGCERGRTQPRVMVGRDPIGIRIWCWEARLLLRVIARPRTGYGGPPTPDDGKPRGGVGPPPALRMTRRTKYHRAHFILMPMKLDPANPVWGGTISASHPSQSVIFESTVVTHETQTAHHRRKVPAKTTPHSNCPPTIPPPSCRRRSASTTCARHGNDLGGASPLRAAWREPLAHGNCVFARSVGRKPAANLGADEQEADTRPRGGVTRRRMGKPESQPYATMVNPPALEGRSIVLPWEISPLSRLPEQGAGNGTRRAGRSQQRP